MTTATSPRTAKRQLCTCITLFCTFRCRHCTTTTWKCLPSHFVEDVNTMQRLSSSFPELRYSLLEFISRKKIANIWRIKWDRISAIKFEAAQVPFLRDVFVADAVVVLKLPILGKKCCSARQSLLPPRLFSALMSLLLSEANQSRASCDNIKNVRLTPGIKKTS